MLSPLNKQYQTIKTKYPDAILLFEVDKYYEAIGEDAIVLGAVLGVTVSQKDNVSLAGFKTSEIDKNLPLLVKEGFRVALCTEMSDEEYKKYHNK